MSDTNIPVSDEVWEELNSRKKRGDTFDDVLRRVLEMNTDDADEPDVAIDSASEPTGETQAAGVRVHDEIPSTVSADEAAVAIDAAVAYIEEHGSATMREIVTEVMPEHDLEYDVPDLESGDRYRGSWWRRVIKPALEQHELVASPDLGESNWDWIG